MIYFQITRLATPEPDMEEHTQNCNNIKKESPALKRKPKRSNNHSGSTSVPVTPKIVLTDTKQRPVSANTEGRSRKPKASIATERNDTVSSRMSKQGNFSSGESLYAYMDPFNISYATPLSDIDMCEDIMELDDETDLDCHQDAIAVSEEPTSSHTPNGESKVSSLRRRSKNTLLQVIDPLMKLDGKNRSNNRRRKSDCNIILNGELVAVGWRRNSATIKICNNTLGENSTTETVF